jgi:hypothetical protein
MKKVRWLVLLVTLVGIASVGSWIEHREYLRRAIDIESSQAGYQNASLARERTEAGLKEYSEITVPQELATADALIKQAEDELNEVLKWASSNVDWAERIRSKGWLLYYHAVSGDLTVKRAKFAVEQARSQKLVLAGYTKGKTEKELSDHVASALADELEKKAAYLKLKLRPRGFLGRLMHHN